MRDSARLRRTASSTGTSWKSRRCWRSSAQLALAAAIRMRLIRRSATKRRQRRPCVVAF
jgi:anti-sigma-K factor RskA